MRTASVRDLKARLSAYLRDVQRGETVLVTDRGRVVARLAPLSEEHPAEPLGQMAARLLALGARPPLRGRRPTDYSRPGPGAGLSTTEIDALLDEVRGDR